MLRDNRKRARTARLLFLLLAGFSAAVLLMASIAPANLAATDNMPTGTAFFYAGFSLLSFSVIALVIGSYIALIMWLRRAYYNLHQLPGLNPEYSDGWAAGAWFVPFLNLVRPFTIVREVWQDTQVAARGRVVEPTTILGWWWAAFLLRLFIGRLTWAMARGLPETDSLTSNDLLSAGLEAGTHLLFGVLTWYIIGRCMRFEEELALRQQVEQLGQPGPEAPAFLQAEQPNYGQPEGY